MDINETAGLLLLVVIAGITGVVIVFWGFFIGITIGAVLALLIIAPRP